MEGWTAFLKHITVCNVFICCEGTPNDAPLAFSSSLCVIRQDNSSAVEKDMLVRQNTLELTWHQNQQEKKKETDEGKG